MNKFIFEEIEDLLADKAAQAPKSKQEKSLEKQAKSTHRKLMAAALGTAMAMGHPSLLGRAATKVISKGGELVGKSAMYAGKKVGEAGVTTGKALGKTTLRALRG